MKTRIKRRYLSITLHFLLDGAFVAGAFWLSFLIHRLEVPNLLYLADFETLTHAHIHFAVFAGVVLLMLAVFDCYNTVWKYAGKVDLYKFLAAYAFSFAIILIYMGVASLFDLALFLPSVIIMFLAFSAIFSGTARFFYSGLRYIWHIRNKVGLQNGPKLKKTLIIGAGYTGMMAVNRFINNPEGYLPVAIVDNNSNKHGMKIYGLVVEGGVDNIEAIVAKTEAEAIIVAVNNISKTYLRELYDKCRALDMPIKVLPPIANADEAAAFEAKELRDIKIEELLGREEFCVQKDLIDVSVADKVVLVTGGAGSIGSELCRQALDFGCKHLIVYETGENALFELGQEFDNRYDKSRYTLVVGNVRDKSKLKATFDYYKPQSVFHAAAYKHVPMMEMSACEAIKNNVMGTINVINQCKLSKVDNLIFISTDKAVNPANIMGASKRIAEMCVQAYGKCKVKMAAVRFGNVLGSNGSVIPIFLRQIKEGGPITLTDRSIQRYFMTIPEAVRLVLQAGAMAKFGEIFVLDMGEPVYIYDLACDLIRINGLIPEKDIEIKVTGLRPGEKMFEELRYDTEAVDNTEHKGIFVNKMDDIDITSFENTLKRLRAAADKEDNYAVERIIFELVPSAYRNGNDEVENGANKDSAV